MRDLITAAVRTGVVALVTIVVDRLARVGITVDPTALDAVLMAVAIGAVNLGLNFLQGKFPWVGSIVSLGLSKESPKY